MNQAARKYFLTQKNDKPAVISAAGKYQFPGNFQICTVEVQGSGDSARSGSYLGLIESKDGQGRDKTLPANDLPASQVWIQKDPHNNSGGSVAIFTSR